MTYTIIKMSNSLKPSDGSTQNRRSSDRQLSDLCERMDKVEGKTSALESKIDANTELTQKIEENTRGIVEAWQAIVGGLQVLAFLAKLAKWGAAIAGFITAGWALVKLGDTGGISPKDISPK